MKRKIPNVFETSMHGSSSWVADLRYHGGQREYFKTKAEAQGRAEEVFNKIFNPGVKVDNVPPELILDAKRGMEVLQPLGGSLLKACEFYADYLKQKAKGNVTLRKAADDWLEYKKMENVSSSTITNHTTRLNSLCARYGTRLIHEIGFKEIHAWLHGLELSTYGKIDYRKTANELFEWAIFPQEWIDKNPCARIKLKLKGEKEVSIFSIKEAQALFHAAKKSDPDILRYVVLCMFAGLRPTEAFKTTREDIRTKTNDIRVHSGKTGRFRYVRMEEGVAKLLTKGKWKGALIQDNFARRWDLLRYNLGYKVWIDPRYLIGREDKVKRSPWPHDVMRHTYCSYHLAYFENEALTAHLAGHDVKVLRKHYRQSIPKAEAKKFWDLLKD